MVQRDEQGDSRNRWSIDARYWNSIDGFNVISLVENDRGLKKERKLIENN